MASPRTTAANSRFRDLMRHHRTNEAARWTKTPQTTLAEPDPGPAWFPLVLPTSSERAGDPHMEAHRLLRLDGELEAFPLLTEETAWRTIAVSYPLRVTRP